jgi:RNA polymerase sigma factor (sigma-70 family)
LNDSHEAEDAFQATFLVLARKAGNIAGCETVANWLFGVALRTAQDARSRAARRTVRERRACELRVVHAFDEESGDDLRTVLDQELARLPDRFRAPILLCEVGTHSRPEAARLLGIPEGTLSSRLARAKVLLRERLTRRGIGLTVAALAAGLEREAQTAGLELSLVEATVKAATGVAAGVSLPALVSLSVSSLTEEVTKAMFMTKLKGIALGFVAVGAVAVGVAVLAQDSPSTGASSRIPAISGYPPGPHATRSESDRLRSVEQKLDRILEALGSAKGTARAFAYSITPAADNTPQDSSATSTTVGLATTAPAVAAVPLTPAAAPPVVAFPPGANVPRRLADLEARLVALERRLADLERRTSVMVPGRSEAARP